jgi:hypothetical protein
MEHMWRDMEKITSQSATLNFTNPTRTGLGINPGLRGDRPERNRLIHDTDIAFK